MKLGLKSGLSPRIGISIAVVAMYILNTIGVAIFPHLVYGPMSFPSVSGNARLVAIQVLATLLVFYAVRILGVTMCGYIIAYTKIERKYLTSVFLVLLFQSFFFTLRLIFRWPWSIVPDLNPIVPLFGEIAGIILLCPFALLGVYWPLLWKRIIKYSKDNNSIHLTSLPRRK